MQRHEQPGAQCSTSDLCDCSPASPQGPSHMAHAEHLTQMADCLSAICYHPPAPLTPVTAHTYRHAYTHKQTEYLISR